MVSETVDCLNIASDSAASLFTPAGSADPSSHLTPAKFVLAGRLASPEDTDPYDAFSDSSVRRMRLRWSKSLSEEGQEEDLASLQVGDADQTSGSLLPPWEAEATQDTTLAVPTLEISAPTPNETSGAFGFDASVSAGLATQDPWDEYSDRATPSPAARRALRPLILCTRPEHARRSSLAMKRLSAAANGNSVALRATATATADAAARAAPPKRGPATIPGRIVHDFFCWVLIFLDYLEWGIILLYRLCLDIRAGPDGIRAKRRARPKRYYL